MRHDREDLARRTREDLARWIGRTWAGGSARDLNRWIRVTKKLPRSVCGKVHVTLIEIISLILRVIGEYSTGCQVDRCGSVV